MLLDLNLPDASGIGALERISKSDPSIPIVVLTGLNDEHFGISAVASGAQDYLVKGRVEPETLRRSLLYAIERKRAELTAVELHASQSGRARMPGSSVVCSPRHSCSTTRASTSSPATGPAAHIPCWAEISTTSCRPRTGPCTS